MFVCTTDALFGTIEEASSGVFHIGVALCLLYLTTKQKFGCKLEFYMAFLLLACCIYLYYMAVQDVPMYLNIWKTDQANHKKYLSIEEGFADANGCKIVSQS